MPLYVHYDCYINLYLDVEDARVQDIQLPDRPVWWSDHIVNRMMQNMLKPIQNYQVTVAGDLALRDLPANQPKQLIAAYDSYLQKTLEAPKAVLTLAKNDLGNPAKRNELRFNGHYKNFLPGLYFLSFKVPYCDLLAASHDTWIWIQKKATGNEPVYNANSFYAFQIPREVCQQPILKRIDEFNNRRLAGR